jgi:hypothetical protein
LVELAGELAVRDVELEKRMTGHQRHPATAGRTFHALTMILARVGRGAELFQHWV